MKDEETTPIDHESGPNGLLNVGLSNKLNDSVKNPQYRIYNELLNYYYTLSNASTSSDPRKSLKRLMNNLVSSRGLDIALFFNEHIATTKPEIQTLTHINWQSVNIIVNLFQESGLLKVLGQVGYPYRIVGKSIPIYGFHHASPENVAEAQRRYGELRRDKLAIGKGQDKMPEALTIVKAYLEKRGLKTLPDIRIITPILKERGISVNYHNLINLLSKEGYKWK